MTAEKAPFAREIPIDRRSYFEVTDQLRTVIGNFAKLRQVIGDFTELWRVKRQLG